MQPSDFESFFEQTDSEMFMQVMAIMLAIMVVCGLLSLAVYILRSLSLHTIGKRRGLANYGLAWVPVAYVWTLGAIADQHDARYDRKRKWRVVLLTLSLVAIGLSMLAYYGYFGMMLGTLSNVDSMQGVDPMAVMQAFAAYCLALIPVGMVGGALNACTAICYYKLYESCRPSRAVCYLLISLLVPFGQVIILLCCRKWDYDLRATSSGDAEAIEGVASTESLPGETPKESENQI